MPRTSERAPLAGNAAPRSLRAGILTRALILVLSGLLVVGCGNPATVGTPAPPNSPQTQLFNVNKTLVDSISAAVNTAISLRNSGQVSAADTRTIENWGVAALHLCDQINSEIGSADSWAVQKPKILLMLPGFQLPVIGSGTVNITLQAALTAVSTTVGLLKGQVQ